MTRAHVVTGVRVAYVSLILFYLSFGFFCITTWGGAFGSIALKLGDGEYVAWLAMVLTGSVLGMLFFTWISGIDKIAKRITYTTRAFPEVFIRDREEMAEEMKKIKEEEIARRFEEQQKKMGKMFKNFKKRNGING